MLLGYEEMIPSILVKRVLLLIALFGRGVCVCDLNCTQDGSRLDADLSMDSQDHQ